MPIEEFAVINAISTGIDFDSIPGQLPTYLVVTACKAANYQYFDSWQQLHPRQQAFLIAHYIANSYVEQHKEDAEAREIKLKAGKK